MTSWVPSASASKFWPSLDSFLNIRRTKDIYVLELENGTYYVGKKVAGDQRRIDIHLGKKKVGKQFSTSWVVKNGPVAKVLHEFPNCSDYDEDRITKMMMSIYGIDKVRGGSYSSCELFQCQKDLLQKLLPEPCKHDLSYFHQQNFTVYCFLLKDDRYYIAHMCSTDVISEFVSRNAHTDWFKKYPFVKVLGRKTNCTQFDADMYLVAAMRKFGLENVRGGNFSSMRLSRDDRTSLKVFIETACDYCYICHEHGHFAKQCRNWRDYPSQNETTSFPTVDSQPYKFGLAPVHIAGSPFDFIPMPSSFPHQCAN